MTNILLIILLVIIVIGVPALLVVLNSKISELKKHGDDDKSMMMLQSQVADLSKVVHERLDSTHRSLQAQFASSSKIITDVTEKLTKLDDTNKQVLNFSAQLQSLENILKNPKQRGILGEYFLEQVMKNVLPPASYQMQYKFKDGEIVDAVIFVKDRVIPIDSKFSLENYNRIVESNDPKEREALEKQFKIDLKNRIDETSKYIRPEEGTMEFAFMFIPSEAIYYDLLISQVGAIKVNTRDLIEYAFKDKHVVIVSPTSFHAYLQTVLQGLRALDIEQQAMGIRENIGKLEKHLLSYDAYMQKLGQQLGTAVGSYNTAYREFGKVNKDITKITGTESSIEMLEIDKPHE